MCRSRPREAARARRAAGCRLRVAVGGGSTIGLGKAIALKSSLPILAIPTTYRRIGDDADLRHHRGRPEEDGPRRTRAAQDRDLRSEPADATLPARIVGDQRHERDCALRGSALRAGRQSDHLADGRGGHPHARREPAERGRRSGGPRGPKRCLYGAWLAGACLGMVGMALHHKLCHTLGGSFNLPHAETHTVVLPHATPTTATRRRRRWPASATRSGARMRPRRCMIWRRPSAHRSRSKDIGMPREGPGPRRRSSRPRIPYYNPRPVEYGAHPRAAG